MFIVCVTSAWVIISELTSILKAPRAPAGCLGEFSYHKMCKGCWVISQKESNFKFQTVWTKIVL